MKQGINIENVSFAYSGKNPQLNNISFAIKKGSFLGITGVNGSGKSTITMLFNGLIPNEVEGHFRGNVFINEVNTRSKPVAFFARNVGMLFQNPDFMLFNLTVREEILFGLNNLKIDDKESRIKDALIKVGLEGFEDRDPQSLSLGQKQKVALACTLALDTEYIVLDEPIAMLDYRSALNLYALLHNIHKNDNKTIIVVEHDTDFLLAYADHMLVMNEGEIMLQGQTQDVIKHTEEFERLGLKIPKSL